MLVLYRIGEGDGGETISRWVWGGSRFELKIETKRKIDIKLKMCTIWNSGIGL